MISEKTKRAVEAAGKAISPELDVLARAWWEVFDKVGRKALELGAESGPFPTEEEEDAASDALWKAVTYRLLFEMLKRA
jgi:hypothetical protein